MTEDPIPPQFHRVMNDVAYQLDQIFNGPSRIGLPWAGPRVGFMLMVFTLDGPERQANYIGNCDRANIIEAMREWIARQEGGNVQ